MLVWIFQTGEPLHIDGKFARPMRAMNLANSLNNAEDEVEIWSSDFFHQKQIHRYQKTSLIKYRKNLKLNLISSIGYNKNISLKRILDHTLLGINLLRKLNQHNGPLPQIVFIGYPPIEFAFVAALFCKKNKIPYVLDIKDQWPDIYIDKVPKIFKSFAKLLIFPYYKMGIWTCKNASAISSITKDFLEWVYDFSGTKPSKRDFIFPLTNINNELNQASDEVENEDEKKLLKTISSRKNKGKKIILFAGSFTEGLDIDPLIFAVKKANKKNKNWIFILCGQGPKWEILNNTIGQCENTFLPGWVTSETIKTISKRHSVGLIIYKNLPHFKISISNKAYQYLSLGIPIFSSVRGTLEKFINKHTVGVNFDFADRNCLYKNLNNYFINNKKFTEQSENALKIYKKKFDGNLVYTNAVNRLREISQVE